MPDRQKIRLSQLDETEVASKLALDALESRTIPYEVIGGVKGKPDVSNVISTLCVARGFTFPDNLGGSVSRAGIPATATSLFSIEKNGVMFAALTFDASDTVGTFSGTGTSFVSGDVLTVVAPASQDATLSNVYFTLIGTLD